jgi:ComF family protein
MTVAAPPRAPARRLLALAGHAFDLVLPPACAACALPGDVLCALCRTALEPLREPACARCAHPGGAAVPECARCPPGIAWARQAVAYAGPAPPLVAGLKDRRLRPLAGRLAEVVTERVEPPPPGAVLVPVPLGRRRRAERGFNQSLLLARALGAAWGLPVVDVLARVKDGPPQRGASSTERVRQVAGAFRAIEGVGCPPLAVLVDDVHTTGATLAACARALRRAGCREVGAVAFARAVVR